VVSGSIGDQAENRDNLSMMRLLLLFPSIGRGGAEEYALAIGSQASREGWEVHAAFPKREGTASLIADFRKGQMLYHPLEIPEKLVRRFTSAKVTFPQMIRTMVLLIRVRPDVVIVNLPRPDVCMGSIAACAFLKVPTAVIFHLMRSRRLFSRRKLRLYQWAATRRQQWIAVSNSIREFVRESFGPPPERVLCIYNGIKNVSSESTSSGENIVALRQEVRKELGLSETSQIALTVGRLSPQKGYEVLIPAIPHAIKEFPDLRFVWAGDGELRDELLRKLEVYGVRDYVFVLGFRSDVQRLLKSADLFVFPTNYEGFPFSLLEAMTAGLPIVSSDASGIPEIIQTHVNGLLFRTGDCCDLLAQLRWALLNPERMKELARNARVRVQDFSEERMLRETLGVLRQLAGSQ
jgi:glycosyltransferase involved in cell wall biosynthesis